jgi:hypothetical protein
MQPSYVRIRKCKHCGKKEVLVIGLVGYQHMNRKGQLIDPCKRR